MSIFTRGFSGRGRDDNPDLPPGQYLAEDFPVLSAGPTPNIHPGEWSFGITNESGEVKRWNWEEFLALPSEEISTDIHCVTRWSKLGTSWKGVVARHPLRRRRDLVRLRDGALVRRLHDQRSARRPARRQGLDRLRVRRRTARPGARRTRATARSAPLLLEEREVGERPRRCRSSTSPASGSRTATTSTATPGRSSGTGDGGRRLEGRHRVRDEAADARRAAASRSTCPTGRATSPASTSMSG